MRIAFWAGKTDDYDVIQYSIVHSCYSTYRTRTLAESFARNPGLDVSLRMYVEVTHPFRCRNMPNLRLWAISSLLQHLCSLFHVRMLQGSKNFLVRICRREDDFYDCM